jgi:hypothetical protein
VAAILHRSAASVNCRCGLYLPHVIHETALKEAATTRQPMNLLRREVLLPELQDWHEPRATACCHRRHDTSAPAALVEAWVFHLVNLLLHDQPCFIVNTLKRPTSATCRKNPESTPTAHNVHYVHYIMPCSLTRHDVDIGCLNVNMFIIPNRIECDLR